MVEGSKPLKNPKHEKFCHEFIKEFNATVSAKNAGFSQKTARQIGSKLLSKIDITDRWTFLNNEKLERVKIDADWVLKQAVECFQETRQVSDHVNARGYLDMCGKHVNVGAFKEKKEVDVKGELTLIERVIEN